VDYELVRGSEDLALGQLLPRVKRESVALDLSSVERIDAAGIATLITLYCSAVEAGNEFYVVDPSLRVLEMLRLVGLESILVSPKVADDVADDLQLGIAFPSQCPAFSRSAA
jgi:anti-anti-sigma regulatory factor